MYKDVGFVFQFVFIFGYSISILVPWPRTEPVPHGGSRVWTTGLPRKSQDIGFGIGQIWILTLPPTLWSVILGRLLPPWKMAAVKSVFLIVILCDRACNAEYRACYSCTHTFIIKCVLPIRSWCRRKPCIFFPSL